MRRAEAQNCADHFPGASSPARSWACTCRLQPSPRFIGLFPARLHVLTRIDRQSHRASTWSRAPGRSVQGRHLASRERRVRKPAVVVSGFVSGDQHLDASGRTRMAHPSAWHLPCDLWGCHLSARLLTSSKTRVCDQSINSKSKSYWAPPHYLNFSSEAEQSGAARVTPDQIILPGCTVLSSGRGARFFSTQIKFSLIHIASLPKDDGAC